MTIIGSGGLRRGGMAKVRWTVAEAKAKFSEVLERAEKEGPQRITKHGRETAVVVSAEDWAKKTKPKPKESLAEFLANSPLRGSGLVIPPREKSLRKIEL
jgi:prevent-host-death family protein